MIQITLTLAVALTIGQDGEKKTDLKAEKQTPQSTMKKYLTAFGQADLEMMRKFYAHRITVLAGSTLQDRNYGGLGKGEDKYGRKKSRTVKLDELVEAYGKAIDRLGGKESWKRSGERFSKMKVLFVTRETKNVKMKDRSVETEKIFKSLQAKKNDVVAIVNPDGDSMAYVLRKNKKNRWLIHVEFWD